MNVIPAEELDLEWFFKLDSDDLYLNAQDNIMEAADAAIKSMAPTYLRKMEKLATDISNLTTQPLDDLSESAIDVMLDRVELLSGESNDESAEPLDELYNHLVELKKLAPRG